MASTTDNDVDSGMTVLRGGGPLHCRNQLPGYSERLRATGRAHHAERLAAEHHIQAVSPPENVVAMYETGYRS